MELSWMGCVKRIAGMDEPRKTMQPGPTAGAVSQAGQTSLLARASATVTRVLQPVHTLRLRPGQEMSGLPESASPAAAPRPITWYGITDRGLVRDHNEDNFSLLDLGDKALFVVADGMGGHDAGEVASRIAMETVCRIVQEEHQQSNDLLQLVEQAVQQANSEVRREGARKGSDMGTTLSVALVTDNVAYIANVGDSRVYCIENDSLHQITTDHSLVAKLVLAGKLTKEEARNHPKSNLLFRTIGIDENVTVDTFCVELKKSNMLLLCTDGLWGEVRDDDMYTLCTTERDIRAVGDRLVQTAKENGGKDNITVVVVRIQ